MTNLSDILIDLATRKLPALTWLSAFDAFWDDRLDALKSAIEKDMQ